MHTASHEFLTEPEESSKCHSRSSPCRQTDCRKDRQCSSCGLPSNQLSLDFISFKRQSTTRWMQSVYLPAKCSNPLGPSGLRFSRNALIIWFFMLDSSTCTFNSVQDLNSQFNLSSVVLGVYNAICSSILGQELLGLLPQSHTHHIMTLWACARYCCDDGATVSRAKSFQAFPPIFLQRC